MLGHFGRRIIEVKPQCQIGQAMSRPLNKVKKIKRVLSRLMTLHIGDEYFRLSVTRLR